MNRVIAVVLCLGCAQIASADVFGFDRLSTNSSQNLAAQFELSVSSLGGNQVELRVANNGPLASVVTRVFISDGTSNFSSLSSIDNSDGGMDGVSFYNAGPGTNFPNKPAGFNTSFSAFAQSPLPVHGVDPSESVGLRFTLSGGRTFADIINAINSGTMMIGIHVQAQPDGESDAFISTPKIEIPSPHSSFLAVMGSIGLIAMRRRIG